VPAFRAAAHAESVADRASRTTARMIGGIGRARPPADSRSRFDELDTPDEI
jgi:hypothetical protein